MPKTYDQITDDEITAMAKVWRENYQNWPIARYASVALMEAGYEWDPGLTDKEAGKA